MLIRTATAEVELDDHVLTAVNSPVNVRTASMVQRQFDEEKAAEAEREGRPVNGELSEKNV